MFTESYCCMRVHFFIYGTVGLFSTICKTYCIVFIFEAAWLRGGSTQPFPRDEEAMELRRAPAVEPHARVQTAEPKTDLHRGKTVKKKMIKVLLKVYTGAAGNVFLTIDLRQL